MQYWDSSETLASWLSLGVIEAAALQCMLSTAEGCEGLVAIRIEI